MQPVIPGGVSLMDEGGFVVQLSWMQVLISVTTLVILAMFTWLVTRTPLGRAMRACEQDLKMASLLGIDTDRTISLTFVIGAALAAVAGMMFLLYYGSIDFYIGFIAGIKAFTAAVLGGIGSLPGAVLGGLLIGLIESLLVGLCERSVQERRRVLDPGGGADLPAHRHPRPRRHREGMSGRRRFPSAPRCAMRRSPRSSPSACSSR